MDREGRKYVNSNNDCVVYMTKDDVIKELESLGFVDEVLEDLNEPFTPFVYRIQIKPNFNENECRILFYSNGEFFRFFWDSSTNSFSFICKGRSLQSIEQTDIASILVLYQND